MVRSIGNERLVWVNGVFRQNTINLAVQSDDLRDNVQVDLLMKGLDKSTLCSEQNVERTGTEWKEQKIV